MRKAFAFAFLFILAGCYAGSSPNNEGLLAETASNYYNLIMWKHYERASLFVDEEKIREFEKFTLEYQDDLNITEYKIREVLYSSDENKGLVKVLVNYYKYPSVSEKTVLLEDIWVLRDKKWYVYSDFDGKVFK